MPHSIVRSAKESCGVKALGTPIVSLVMNVLCDVPFPLPVTSTPQLKKKHSILFEKTGHVQVSPDHVQKAVQNLQNF